LFSQAAGYAQTEIKAQVDKVKISTDEVLTYKVTVASDEKNLPAPVLPQIKGFSVVSRLQSSQISLGAEKLKASAAYIFFLAPTEAGCFTIGPTTVKVKDEVYSTESFEIEVTPGKAKPLPQPKTEKNPLFPETPAPESEEPQFTL
jgi:hypothetical protein